MEYDWLSESFIVSKEFDCLSVRMSLRMGGGDPVVLTENGAILIIIELIAYP